MISARHVVVRHGIATTLDDVSIGVEAGECVGVSGDAGSGKTTLLRVLAGMVRPASGSMHLHGEVRPADALRLRRSVCYAAADAMVGHGLRVDEYLRFVARVRAPRGATEVSAAADAARRAGLEPSAAIAMLTAQQCAALAIAAAVVANVSAILIDEAVDALTFAERERVTSWLVEIRDRGVAMLVATKDADVQKSLCHRVLRLVRGRVAEERRSAAATAGATASQAVSSVGSL